MVKLKDFFNPISPCRVENFPTHYMSRNQTIPTHIGQVEWVDYIYILMTYKNLDFHKIVKL